MMSVSALVCAAPSKLIVVLKQAIKIRVATSDDFFSEFLSSLDRNRKVLLAAQIYDLTRSKGGYFFFVYLHLGGCYLT